MACYHPRAAWYAQARGESGKRGITFRLSEGYVDRPVEVPCGTCVGCRLEWARQWAVRCEHESKCHERSSFVTLTYERDPVSLRPEDFVRFMKRLRHEYATVRYLQCGEYGGEFGRPHHHALLFGVSFPDARYYKGQASERLFTSKSLERLWTHGQCTIGEVTFKSAGYVARYAMKKSLVDREEWRARGLVPEYMTMSRRPGIGRAWADRYRSQWYRQDFVVVNGVECRPPRYYDQVEEKAAPAVLARVKAKRRREGAERAQELREQLGPSEGYKREEVKAAQVQFLRRSEVT